MMGSESHPLNSRILPVELSVGRRTPRTGTGFHPNSCTWRQAGGCRTGPTYCHGRADNNACQSPPSRDTRQTRTGHRCPRPTNVCRTSRQSPYRDFFCASPGRRSRARQMRTRRSSSAVCPPAPPGNSPWPAPAQRRRGGHGAVVAQVARRVRTCGGCRALSGILRKHLGARAHVDAEGGGKLGHRSVVVNTR